MIGEDGVIGGNISLKRQYAIEKVKAYRYLL